nr:hypothetical protein [Herbaspirillum sp. ASV7]
MNVIQSLLHYGSYAVAFYALYFVVAAAAASLYLWQRVYRKPALRPVPVRVRADLRDLRDHDSRLR